MAFMIVIISLLLKTRQIWSVSLWFALSYSALWDYICTFIWQGAFWIPQGKQPESGNSIFLKWLVKQNSTDGNNLFKAHWWQVLIWKGKQEKNTPAIRFSDSWMSAWGTNTFFFGFPIQYFCFIDCCHLISDTSFEGNFGACSQFPLFVLHWNICIVSVG